MTAPTVTARPLLDAGRPRLADHEAGQGALPHVPDLVAQLAASGLTGRGGAAFPVAGKLAAVRAARGRPVVIANGAEGEPASAKDRLVLARAPHLVLDGLALVAAAVGARRAYAVIAPDVAGHVVAALAERRDRVRVEVVEAGTHFVAGQETAVVATVEGRPALPSDARRRVAESGVGGRPTLVQNVETLAHIALIARRGAGWFRENGTAGEPGTLLVTVGGGVGKPGVLEVPHGAPLAGVLDGAGARRAPVLVGGFHGAWLAPDEVERVDLSRASLEPYGAAPGAGVLHVLPDGADGMVETARITSWLAGQSARQCGPCRGGLPRLAELVGRIAAGDRDPRTRAAAERIAGLTAGRGACHHPDGTVRLVRSALRLSALGLF